MAMTDENLISQLESLQFDKVNDNIKKKIKMQVKKNNDVNSIIENIDQIVFPDDEKYENFPIDMLYKHLVTSKKLAQLALNSLNLEHLEQCRFEKRNVDQTYLKYFQIIKKNKCDEDFLIGRISYYITIFSLLSHKEFDKNCRTCNSSLSKNSLKCPVCNDSVSDEEKIVNIKMRTPADKIDLPGCCDEIIHGKCEVCNSEIIDGKCKCGKDSNLSISMQTSIQKTKKDDGDQSKQIRSTSSKISSNHNIDSDSVDRSVFCRYCDNKIINGKCCICGNNSNTLINLEKSVHKTKKGYSDQLKQIRCTSSKISSNQNIDSNSSSHWTCNVCSYQNNESSINCKACVHSKFAEVMTCTSNENNVNSLEHDEDSFNQSNTGNAENKDKWRCEQCTFNNEISASFCNDSKFLTNVQTSIQKTNKSDGDQSKQIRSTSSKVSSNQNIDSNSSSHWTCNVCSYQNNESSINCQACMSSKFSQVNSCTLESSYETLKKNDSNSLEHDECSFNQSNTTNAENEDKWRCEQCTFNNEISASLCKLCFTPNVTGYYELPEETWSCKKCGENNLFECYKCKKCRSPAEFFNKWRCEQCSFYNDKVANQCEVCEIRNPYLIKCNLCAKNLVNKKYDTKCKKCTTILFDKFANENVAYQDNINKISKQNNQPINYLESNKAEMSKFKKDQRSEKPNENQTNVKRNVSQKIEKRDQFSIPDTKKNSYKIANLTIHKSVDETQLETCKPFNSLSPIDQAREKPNENQTNVKRGSSRKIEKKDQFSTTSTKKNSYKIANLTIHKSVDKIQVETSKPFNSFSQINHTREKPNENQTNLKRNVSQDIEKKNKNSTVDKINYGRIDNLEIYNNFDKTQPESFESKKVLSKGDQRNEKPCKNQRKSNNEFPEYIKINDKISTIDTKRKINSKLCQNCKSKVCANNQHWCSKCDHFQWFCLNEACDLVNFENEFCKKCKAKKGSDFLNCINFWVMKDGKEVQMWQCGFCFQFVTGTLKKCNNCQNLRDLSCYIKCKCNWNNLTVKKECNKCMKNL